MSVFPDQAWKRPPRPGGSEMQVRTQSVCRRYPEVIVAIHGGIKVLGLSVIANVNDPDNFQPILLEDIIKAAEDVKTET